MTLTRDELDHLTGKGGGRLTKEELEQLPPEWREKVQKWPGFDQGRLSELLKAQAAETAKLDAKIAKKTAFLHKAAIRNRVLEALVKSGAGKHAELLGPHVETRVRVVEQEDAIDFRVVDRDGKPRLRDGRPMRVEELMDELKRMPELEGFFTTNNRRAP